MAQDSFLNLAACPFPGKILKYRKSRRRDLRYGTTRLSRKTSASVSTAIMPLLHALGNCPVHLAERLRAPGVLKAAEHLVEGRGPEGPHRPQQDSLRHVVVGKFCSWMPVPGIPQRLRDDDLPFRQKLRFRPGRHCNP